MGNTVWDYVASEASSSTTGGWNTAENQDPSTVNDGMRQHKQNVYNLLRDFGGGTTTAGTANAQTVTLNQAIATTVPTNFIFRVKIGSGLTNTSSTVTLNVNSIGAKTVKVNYGGVLAAPIPGDIQAGSYCTFLYDGTYLVLLDSASSPRAQGVQAKTSGFTIDGTHFGKTIVATSGTFTVALTAAATLGDGFWFDIRNEGTGCVTIDPNSSETINGQTTLAFFRNGGRVVCDGTNWRIIGLSQRELISSQSASTSASIDFTAISNSMYSTYELIGDAVLPATNSVNMLVRVSTSATFDTGNNYRHENWRFTSSASGVGGSTSDSAFIVNSASETLSSSALFSFSLRFYNPSASNGIKRVNWQWSGLFASTSLLAGVGGGIYAQDAAVDGFRVLMSSGNIASGTFELWADRRYF